VLYGFSKRYGEDMDQPNYSTENIKEAVNKWLFQDAIDIEKDREELRAENLRLREERDRLEEEKRCLEADKRQLNLDRQELAKRIELETQRHAREKELFEMKWKILEEELVKLSKEKVDLEILKENYTPKQGIIVEGIYGSMMFKGVTNELELKKRYKDLMKIYHPDNVAGDDSVVQEINKEYDALKTEFRARY
jgi:hypothetical protein